MKVAIFGLGNFGIRWLDRILKFDSECFVYGISSKKDHDISNTTIIDNLYRVRLIDSCPQEKIDLCIVCTPAISDVRADLIHRFAKLTRFMIIEKPITLSYPVSKDLVDHLHFQPLFPFAATQSNTPLVKLISI